ncbi:MAG: exonuclease SbcD [Alteromonadaceae bacterium]|jgi:exonuclease SbcD
MRIIHTSDWHLGQNFYGKTRAAEHKQFLAWLLKQITEQNVDAVVVAGDIFDTGSPPSYARELYFDFIVELHQLECQLVILAGNHDSVAMLGESKQLLNSLSTKVIPAVTENIDEQVFYLNDKNGQPKCVICAIPFIRPRDITKSLSGQSAVDKQQSLQQAISDHYQHLFEHAQQLASRLTDKPCPIIATGHLTAVGVTISESVREIYIGTLDAFPANAFPKADYIALGHIHRAQKVAKSEHIRYSGSPIPLSFDEAKQNKVVVMVDFTTNETQISELAIPCFQPMAMVKTQLDSIDIDVKCAVAALNEGEILWLDIEIDSAQYLDNLTSRIEQLIEAYPVDILLVRRSKSSREAMPMSQKKITLNELTLTDVFDTRLEQESWQSEQELARKSRLTQLFKQATEQVQDGTLDIER